MDFLLFLGRFHVLALHLPIGIILAAVVLECMARRDKYRYLNSAGPFVWGAAAVTSILTVVLGYLHFAEGGFDGPSGTAHRLYGTSVAAVAVLIWFMRARANAFYRRVQLAAAVVIVVLVTMTGHYGGNLTHGSTYLLEYAPQPIRSLAGLAARRPPVTDLDQADAYLDVIRPILEARCASCHGSDKQSGEFDMSTHASTLAGGETGTAVVPGNASVSELYRRITLAEDHDAFMPAEGRTPLTTDQVSIIEWWIDAGAPSEGLLGAMNLPVQLRPVLARSVGLVTDAAAQGASGTARADPEIVSSLAAAGFLPRQMSQADAGLSVSAASPGRALTEQQLQSLVDAAAAIGELSLPRAGLGDSNVSGLASMINLKRLRLGNNDIGDTALESIARLQSLETLNLYGNPGITDAAIDLLAQMPSLQQLFIWQTSITPDGVARLRSARPDIDVQAGTAEAFSSGAAQAISEVVL